MSAKLEAYFLSAGQVQDLCISVTSAQTTLACDGGSQRPCPVDRNLDRGIVAFGSVCMLHNNSE